MSSEDMAERATRHRTSLAGKVTAMQFGFPNKKRIGVRGMA